MSEENKSTEIQKPTFKHYADSVGRWHIIKDDKAKFSFEFPITSKLEDILQIIDILKDMIENTIKENEIRKEKEIEKKKEEKK